MAIERPITNAPVSAEERTWRATIETPRTGFNNYSITVHREVLQKDAQGSVVSVLPGPTVTRRAADIAQESVQLSGRSVPAMLILGGLPEFFDRWAQEDAQSAVPAAEVAGRQGEGQP